MTNKEVHQKTNQGYVWAEKKKIASKSSTVVTSLLNENLSFFSQQIPQRIIQSEV